MTIYQFTTDKLLRAPSTTFAAEGLFERKDLQRLLRQDISVLGEDLLVVAEEYGNWEDSGRRIDLLCLNSIGDLVVVEIKRTDDGGHMELQAIRYAAMVSSMTLEQVIEAHSKTNVIGMDEARAKVLEFLDQASDDSVELTGSVRITLVSANFSTELTTSVLWVNSQGLDVTCIRLIPYKVGNDLVVDITQIIPLPEAADYNVKMRAQDQEKRKVNGRRQEVFLRFWSQLIERSKARTQLLAGRSTSRDHWLSTGIGKGGFALSLSLTQLSATIECNISLERSAEKTKASFQALLAQRAQVEATFGSSLDWRELPDRIASRICWTFPGGWTMPEAEWPSLQDKMIDGLIRMDKALRTPIHGLKL